ncbi:MAG: hypothetical protein V1750_05785 [Acidobacteriota bacterium]
MEWRLILDAPARGVWNMAVDEALVEALDTGASPPVLRLNRWAPEMNSAKNEPAAAAGSAHAGSSGPKRLPLPSA